MVYAYESYIIGLWPPQEKSFSKSRKVIDNLAASHIKAYELIRNIYKKSNLSPPFISIAQNIQAFEPYQDTLKNKLATYLRYKSFNLELIERLIRARSLDFIGINYYTRSLVEVGSWNIRSLLLDTCKANHSQLPKNSLGWDIYPEGLYKILLRLKKYRLPLFILENGICTDDDKLRWDFIYDHLKSLGDAIESGVKIFGYIYWSLIDNFEWDKGFSHRFGLIEVDYKTYNRVIRTSARKFSEVCKSGILN
jgi:beta-glucosidase